MKIRFILITFLISLSTSLLLSQQNFQLQSAEMSIEGTSTLYDWTSKVQQLSAEAEIEIVDNQLVAIPYLKVRIPVKEIKSSKGIIMDKRTYSTMNAEEYPHIQFELDKIELKEQDLLATGQLFVSGQTRTIQFSVAHKVLPTGAIQFIGAHTLKMMDYELKPPTFGTLKTGDEVTIRFSCVLASGGDTSKTK
ncbi:MAG: YceI family protein [Bacteroidota bacterium]